MKIAIVGHKTRGREVIKLLESLGGRRGHYLQGNSESAIYFIKEDLDNLIVCDIPYNYRDYKKYTLEEFKTEFPFKIGDKVTVLTDTIYKVVALEYYMGELHYKLDNGLHYSSELLTLYKEMKAERNITLTLDKAREWYNKNKELREIALQAFTEQELNPTLPKTWEEFCENYPVKKGESWLTGQDTILTEAFEGTNRIYKNWTPSYKSAEAHLAMIQLEQLRNCWWNGWEPIWDASHKWCIRLWGNELNIGITTNISRFLTFPTKEMAEEFLKCFTSLIVLAKDLI